MDILLSVLLGELTTRSINFFIRKCSKPSTLEVEDRLRRLLLRVQVIIQEAMGRQITNQALLLQLNMLRDDMHRGYYVLDTFRYQSRDEEATKDKVVSQALSLSKASSAKGLHSSNRNTEILEQLQKALDNLSSMIIDAEEMVMFLMSYPRMYSQPYSMHLQLGNCMFGRQMETELVINFLLHTQPNRAEELEVLPIVGPDKVGKSTLVAHVCNNERVRDHFSEILFLRDHDLKDEKLTYLRGGCAKRYQNSILNKDGRVLVIVEVAGDINEGEWKRLYAASKRCVASGSKIIITSRSDKITKFGTTMALTLKYLSHEAYWYFFKTLTFGSTDPRMHPRMSYVAMEIARMVEGPLLYATSTICLLKENFDIRFWCKAVTFLRSSIKWHVSKFGEVPCDTLNQNRPAYIWRMVNTFEQIMVCHQYECSSQEEVPKIALRNVMYGSIKPPGRFKALVWRSTIPPYYNYIYTCEILNRKTTAAKRKRS